ncbi:glucosamine-fructose-6-phosphate aminotransferase [Enterococcus sp. JM4C]|uniref:SIS domain-containing protein n=1 Tax=Candidatus Enterococcus huntleyi TaxID=1857217 RepID=UPI00137B48E5|nr:SIS domain-containing protein [Enterococcus sp. JM4C]KAF1299443.1 glucosamine-fructose-6-phosphate aminotransferase [Enterococcus sp. JM4C]
MATMMDYIGEEQATLANSLKNYRYVETSKQQTIKNVLILATGSSYNACLAAKPALESLAEVTVTIEEPYHFNHYGHLSTAVDTVIAVSQSGKSASTIDAIGKLKEQGIYTMALTSDLSSPICQKVNEVIDLEMGIETVGFVTKGFTATVLKLFLLGLSIGQNKEILSAQEVNQYLAQLEGDVAKIPEIIEKSQLFFEKNESIFKLANRFIAIGYGPNWGTAKEFETKFTETIRKPSQGFELEAYMHGPYLEADHEHVLFFIEAESENRQRSQRLKEYMKPFVGKAYTVTTRTATTKDGEDCLGLSLTCDERFSSLFLVIPFQLLAYRGAAAKGIDLSVRIFDDFDQVLKSKI